MKHCIDCNQHKPYSEFVPKNSCKDGYEIRCRTCRSIRFNRSTPDKLIRKIYRTQTMSSISRGHTMPNYTLEDLSLWVQSQPNFQQLWNAFVASNYSKELIPSVDRLDDTLPYTFNNIQLTTWQVNRNNGAIAKSQGIGVDLRAVVAYNIDGTLYKTFISIMEAVRHIDGRMWGVASVANGTPVKDGKGKLYQPKTYKGFIWKWL